MKTSKHFCLPVSLFLLIIFTIKTNAQLFLPKVDYATGLGPNSVAIGDFNSDNKSDLAVTNRNANNVSILLGNGDGTFQNKVDYGTGTWPYSVAIGDFNGDNKSDFAVANYNSNKVSIFLGNGDGTFQNKVDYGTGTNPLSVAIGDFNGDNKTDLAIANTNSSNVSILLGNGDGTFQNKVDYGAGSAPMSVAIGDFNGDNKTDLAVANRNNNNISIFLGNGDGTFQNKVDYAVGSGPFSVAIGDFNRDNKSDLAVANVNGNNVSILLGNGNGTFQNKVDYGAGTNPASVAIGDFNGDNKTDLAVANSGSNNVSILLGNGDGTFQNKVDYGAGTYSYSVAISDFNGDNKSDLAVANYNDNNVSILIHTNSLPTAANGSVTINEDNMKIFAASEFNYADADNDPLNKIQITSLPLSGTLFKDDNLNSIVDAGETLALNGEVTKAEIDANKLKFIPGLNGNGSPYTTYNFKVHDGTVYSSNSYTMTINVNAVNDVPVLAAIEVAALNYTEGNAATAVTNTITISDVDDTNIESATVQVTGNYQNGQDVLSFTNQNGITGSWTAATGTMALSGSATKANYQTALRDVKYLNTSNNPLSLIRTVSFLVNDGDVNSNILTRNVSVASINTAPVLYNIESEPIEYRIKQSSYILSKTIVVEDADDNSNGRVIISITENYQTGEDELVFNNQDGITGEWNSNKGILYLYGNVSVSNYQAALRTVCYRNNKIMPNKNSRTISIVFNDGDDDSNTLFRKIVFISGNTAPIITGIETDTLKFLKSDIRKVVSESIIIGDVDNLNLQGAMIKIGRGFIVGEDVLEFSSLQNVQGIYNWAKGTIELTGQESLIGYQNILRTVKYKNIKGELATKSEKTIEFTVTDGVTISNIGTRQIKVDGVITGTGELEEKIPTKYKLYQNYPNPFNPTTSIRFGLAESAMTKLIIYDALGREVLILVNQELGAGYHEINFDGSQLSNGVYFYCLQAGTFTETKKLILLK